MSEVPIDRWMTHLEGTVCAAAVIRRAWEADPNAEHERALRWVASYVMFIWLAQEDEAAQRAWLEAHADGLAITLEAFLAGYAEAGVDLVGETDTAQEAWRRSQELDDLAERGY